MIQTGQRPPVKILGDKGTWKHNTRMMSGLTTVVPDSPSLIQAFFVGSDCCPGGSGDEQTRSLTAVFDRYICGSQYLGLAADGATLHCNVGVKLGEHYGKKGHDDYDPLHKAGIVDVRMKEEKSGPQFRFLQADIDMISEVNRFFIFGVVSSFPGGC